MKHRLRRIAWAFLAGSLWILLVLARPYVIRPDCPARLERCTVASVPSWDRPGVGLESGDADGYSLWTQNASGVLAIGGLMAWHATTAAALGPGVAAAALGDDLITFTQAWFWNGSLNEVARLVVQRPRPFVYADPSRGGEAGNYTSFYSGHTSFSAMAVSSLFLLLLARRASGGVLLLAALSGETLVISTAVFRIFAGRHFLSDVVAGAIAGTLVAWTVVRRRAAMPPA